MQYLSAKYSYLGPGFALLLALVGIIYGVFGWRIVRMLVVLDAIALAGMIAYALQEPAIAEMLPVSPVIAAAFVAFVLPLIAFRYPRKAAVAFFGIVGFLATLLLLLDMTSFSAEFRIAICIFGAAVAMGLGLTLYEPTTVFVTGIHGGFLCAAGLAIVAAYPATFIGRMVQAAESSFEYALPAAGIAFSAILIAVQWADLQGSEAAEEAFTQATE